MNAGQVLQVGAPQEVFTRPANAEVARIVGVETVVQGLVVANDNGLATVSVNGTMLKGLGADVSGLGCVRVHSRGRCLARAGGEWGSPAREISCPAW